MASETVERCVEPRCNRERAGDGLRCVLHANRLGQTQSVPSGLPAEIAAPIQNAVVVREPREITRRLPAQRDRGRTLTALGYGAIAAGWAGIGLLLADAIVPGALLSVGGHAAALGLAVAAAVQRRSKNKEVV